MNDKIKISAEKSEWLCEVGSQCARSQQNIAKAERWGPDLLAHLSTRLSTRREGDSGGRLCGAGQSVGRPKRIARIQGYARRLARLAATRQDPAPRVDSLPAHHQTWAKAGTGRSKAGSDFPTLGIRLTTSLAHRFPQQTCPVLGLQPSNGNAPPPSDSP